MEKVNPAERRVNSRAPIDMNIEVCHLQEEEQVSGFSIVSCRGRDVSGGGVSFYGQNRYQNESLLRLRIPLSDNQNAQRIDSVKFLKVMGKVMWSKKTWIETAMSLGSSS